jgi:hypothetical protein
MQFLNLVSSQRTFYELNFRKPPLNTRCIIRHRHDRQRNMPHDFTIIRLTITRERLDLVCYILQGGCQVERNQQPFTLVVSVSVHVLSCSPAF